MHDIVLTAAALAASAGSLAALLALAYVLRGGPRYRRATAAQSA